MVSILIDILTHNLFIYRYSQGNFFRYAFCDNNNLIIDMDEVIFVLTRWKTER